MNFRIALSVSMLASLIVSTASAADYDVSAKGRCVYRDETGALKPLSGALVELRDQDMSIPVSTDVVGPVLQNSLNRVCGTATSGADGRFEVRGRCGDTGPSWLPTSKPDLYVRCALQSTHGRIFNKQVPFTLYNATSGTRRDNTSAYDVGNVIAPMKASRALLSLNEVASKLTSLAGQRLDPIWVQFPGGREAVIKASGATYWASYAMGVFMSLSEGKEGTPTVAHEFGHTMQFMSFVRDLNRQDAVLNVLRAGWESTQHPVGQGHNYETKSNPVMAYAEGFAEFIAGVVYNKGLPDCTKWQEKGANETDKISVEGNVACRMFRLYQKWGFREIWEAQKASKAVRYDHFFEEYKKKHADAASVAVPAQTLILQARPWVGRPLPAFTVQPVTPR